MKNKFKIGDIVKVYDETDLEWSKEILNPGVLLYIARKDNYLYEYMDSIIGDYFTTCIFVSEYGDFSLLGRYSKNILKKI